MSLDTRTQEQRLALANALARAEAQVRQNVNRLPVNYPEDVQAALVALNVLLDATIVDAIAPA